MVDVAALRISIDSGDLKRASIELDKLARKGATTERSTDKLNKSFKMTASSISLMNVAMTGFAAVMAAQRLIKYADEMTQINSKIKLVTKSNQDLIKVEKELFKISQNARVGYADTADLYARMGRSVKNTTITQEELLKVTDTISKSLIISGSSAESANAALVQLGQGFAADALRGQELNSVMEQTPRLAQAMAEGLGIGLGELRAVAAEGLLTTEKVVNAILKSGKSVNTEFSQMAMTVGQSTTTMDNSFLGLVGRIDETQKASQSLSSSIRDISKYIDENRDSIVDTVEDIIATATMSANGLELVFQTSRLHFSQMYLDFEDGINTSLSNVMQLTEDAINFISNEINTTSKWWGDALDIDFGAVGTVDFPELRLDSDDLNKRVIESTNRIIELQKSIEQSTLELATNSVEVSKSVEIQKKLNEEIAKQTKLTKKQIEAAEKQAKLNARLQLTYDSIVGTEYEIFMADVTRKMIEMSKSTDDATISLDKYYEALMQEAPITQIDTAAIEEKRKQQELDYEFQTAQANLLKDTDDRAVAMANLSLQRIKDEYQLRVQMGTLAKADAEELSRLADEHTEKLVEGYSAYGRTMETVGQSMENSFMQFADATSEKFGDLKALGLDMAQSIYQALLKNYVIGQAASSTSAGSGIVGAITSSFFAQGGAISSPSLSAYSNTVVSQPTPFMFASGGTPGNNVGVFGEAGSEAIMPLTRTSDGDLVVKMVGENNNSIKNVSVNITNESGENLEVSSSDAQFDMESMVMHIVLNSVSSNKYNARNMIGNG